MISRLSRSSLAFLLLLSAALRVSAQAAPATAAQPSPPAVPPTTAQASQSPDATPPSAQTPAATTTPPAVTAAVIEPQPSAATPQPVAPAPAPQATAPSQPVATPAADALHARRALHALAHREHDARVYGSYGMFITGAAVLGGGLAADLGYHRSFGEPMWIIGIVVGVGGALNLMHHGPLETLARDTDALTAEDLKHTWAERAARTRGVRQRSGVINLAAGAVAAGVGGAIAAGLGRLTERQKQDWSIGLIASGGAVMASGLSSLLVESMLETGYREAYGTEACAPIAVSIAPARGGAAVSLQARF